MRKKLTRELKLKDLSVFSKGHLFEIKVKESAPTIAELKDLVEGSARVIKIKSLSLYKYFPGFETLGEEISDLSDSVVPSLTGESVEPDGWDEHGFPSVLLAAGYI